MKRTSVLSLFSLSWFKLIWLSILQILVSTISIEDELRHARYSWVGQQMGARAISAKVDTWRKKSSGPMIEPFLILILDIWPWILMAWLRLAQWNFTYKSALFPIVNFDSAWLQLSIVANVFPGDLKSKLTVICFFVCHLQLSKGYSFTPLKLLWQKICYTLTVKDDMLYCHWDTPIIDKLQLFLLFVRYNWYLQ